MSITLKTVYSTCVSGDEVLTLDATTGAELISETRDIFAGGIDRAFRDGEFDGPQEPASEVNVTIHDMIKDCNFSRIYDEHKDDLDAMSVSQGQIIQFCVKYQNWIRAEYYGIFFLLKFGGSFFIVRIFLDDDGRPVVAVRPFTNDFGWGSRCDRRFVVPLPLVA